MNVTSVASQLALLLASCLACGGSLPGPKRIEQPRSAFQEVPHPPPAAFVELVPKRPRAGAVWIDGNWAWRGKGFVWERGGWVEPAPTARYSAWQLQYQTDGTVLFASCGWFDERGTPLEAPSMLAPASTPPNEVTSEFHSAR